MHARGLVAVVLGTVFMMSPLAVLAQSNSAGYCPTLTKTLQYGSRDSSTSGQVSELQKFFAAYYGLDASTVVTGFFGLKTQQFVVQFQNEQNISAIGVVGPQTRNQITAVCNTPVVSSQKPPSVPVSNPVPQTPPSPVNTLSYVGPLSCSLYALSPSVSAGQNTLIYWTSIGATNAVLDGVGTVATNGMQSVTPLNTTTYNLTVTSGQSTATCSQTVAVTRIDTSRLPNVPQASCNLFTVPFSITNGQSATLSWNATGAYAGSISSVGPVSASGSQFISPATTTTYTGSFVGFGGGATCATTLTVATAQ